ncbi:arad-like aldolase/epimerase [Eremomyces bilateralis CBS 781.70]|uniref:Arad-like aldolase/epimerase n=1 Tax=Eremomyces bilateralis CBS 781.70 TaxID=1392243 RepID=A0A6G1FSJ8_9PEZI|nr:arad-like aldolase/epimerase [Eremomyces bilateralis CBS 781.70]KAF1808754.1 arad-like aldolase/epimerase [Eremomyces bilateralis CBS 781.70]
MAPSATTTTTAALAPSTKTASGNTSFKLKPDSIPRAKDEESQTKQQTPLQAISHGNLSLPGVPSFPDFASQRQWQLEHMAAAFRHWDRMGYVEGMSGHISVRDPEIHDAFWTNPIGVHFGMLNASDMILVNFQGEVIGGNQSRPPNAAGVWIHGSIHKAWPHVHAVCHCHSVYGKTWSVFGKPLEMLTQDTCKFFGDAQAVYDNHGGVVLAAEEGERIASALGPTAKGCVLRNHGLLTVGQTVDEAAWLFTSMENSCRVQLLADAAAANDELKKVLISDTEARFNFEAEGDPEVCHAEFQVYYDYEDRRCQGEFKDFKGL